MRAIGGRTLQYLPIGAAVRSAAGAHRPSKSAVMCASAGTLAACQRPRFVAAHSESAVAHRRRLGGRVDRVGFAMSG